MKNKLILFIFIFNVYLVVAEPTPLIKGCFLKDTIKVGEPVAFCLSVHYRSNQTVLFPDSSYTYFPFEFLKKKAFPTRSAKGWSIDSACYIVSTFETLPRLGLSLPVFFIHGTDSIRLESNNDSVYVRLIVQQLPDSVQLKENVVYQSIPTAFNYPYFIVGGIVFFILVLLIAVLFGKRIRQFFQLRRLKKEYNRFMRLFDMYLVDITDQNYISSVDKIYALWKMYLQSLEKIPYTTYSSSEIKNKIQHEQLVDILDLINQAIYGYRYDSELKQSISLLKEIASEKYYSYVTQMSKK